VVRFMLKELPLSKHRPRVKSGNDGYDICVK
jgi:hypothetical protein